MKVAQNIELHCLKYDTCKIQGFQENYTAISMLCPVPFSCLSCKYLWSLALATTQYVMCVGVCMAPGCCMSPAYVGVDYVGVCIAGSSMGKGCD